MMDPLRRGAFACALVATLAFVPSLSHAEDSVSLEPWLGHNSPKCATMEGLDKVAKVATLTPDQFQFVRALFVAIPPVSHELPPGDHAIIALAQDGAMAGLMDGDVMCARIALPDFMVEMLMAVGRGDVTHVGNPL